MSFISGSKVYRLLSSYAKDYETCLKDEFHIRSLAFHLLDRDVNINTLCFENVLNSCVMIKRKHLLEKFTNLNPYHILHCPEGTDKNDDILVIFSNW